MRWFPLWNRRRGSSDDRGVTTVEYGILIAGVGILAVGGLLAIRDSAQSNYQSTTAGTGVCVGSGCNAISTLPVANLPTSTVLSLSGYTDIIGVVGTAYTSPTPTVTNGSGTNTFSIASGVLPAGLTLNSATGVISGTPSAAYSTALLSIRVSNSSGTATQSISVSVINPGAILLSGYTDIAGRVGSPYTSPTPVVSNGANVNRSFAVTVGTLPSGLTLNSSTGVISGTPVSTAGPDLVTITVTDDGKTASQTITVTVAPQMTLTGYSNITARVGTAFTSGTPTVSNGSGTNSFSISDGSLPAGLAINNLSGVISGTPTAVSAASDVTVRVANTNGVATQTISVSVIPGLSISGFANVDVKRGSSYTSPTPTVTGLAGSPTFSISGGTLPTGLAINASSGVISGTATTRYVASSVTIRVSDSAGGTADQTVTMNVYDVPAQVTGLGSNNSPGLDNNSRQLRLWWNAPNNNGNAITAYEIEYRTNPPSGSVGAWTPLQSETVAYSSSSPLVVTMPNSVRYDFRIRAVNDAGPGAFSAAKTETAK
jgi:hypothetical protein